MCCLFSTDFSEAQHFLVTLMSTPEDDDGSAVPLFVTVKDEFVVEKNYTGKVSEHSISIPRVQSTKYGLHSFCYSASKYWSMFPEALRTAES